MHDEVVAGRGKLPSTNFNLTNAPNMPEEGAAGHGKGLRHFSFKVRPDGVVVGEGYKVRKGRLK